ncbi:MAG: alanine racemase [Gammaproteobacteria bacterium]|nr:alanine racemase [Gammaproteobacteria bacterium]
MNSHGANRYSSAIIDLAAIRHNYQLLKQVSDGKRLIAVVKADAYGHGAVEVSKTLPDADAFAVATVGEAVALREAGIKQKILVLGGFISLDELYCCVQNQFDPVISNQRQVEYLSQVNNLQQIQVWVKFDSGMGRLGFSGNQVIDTIAQLEPMPSLGKVRLMSHLARADDINSDFTNQQIAAVRALGLDRFEWGVANSAGILGWADAHNDWVRAGIAMYGASPMSNRHEVLVDLKPAMTMKSQVLTVTTHQQGDFIGYSNAYCCPRDMTIAVIATGYADGYPRHKANTAQVNIHGQLCDIVGRVSMDMITADVSTVAQVSAGDAVYLFGESPDANCTAECAETIAYEILCNVGAHVRREYINNT